MGASTFQFKLSRSGIVIIANYICDHAPVVLTNWGRYLNCFTTKPSLIIESNQLYNNSRYFESVLEQGDNATFDRLLNILEDEDLNNLHDTLQEAVDQIKNAQDSPKFQTTDEKIQNFWFKMTDVVFNFVGRQEELETLHKLVTSNKSDEDCCYALLTSVQGFGGIGKSTLARKYAWTYRHHFNGNIIWIDSESFTTMKSSFDQLIVKLGLLQSNELDISSLVRPVYEKFIDSKSLFIFDNVVSFDGQGGFAQFLPDGIQKKPFLLMTSRRRDCLPPGNTRALELDVLKNHECTDLIWKYLPNASEDMSGRLAERMSRLPLTLHQAIVYIRTSLTNTSAEFENQAIVSFLEEYERNSKRITQGTFKFSDGYALTVYLICKMILQSISLKETRKGLGKHIMKYISLLDSDNITTDLLLKLIDTEWFLKHQYTTLRNPKHATPNDVKSTMTLLANYSLIARCHRLKAIQVHRLVQDATKPRTNFMKRKYLRAIVRYLTKQDSMQNLLHWTSIKRSCDGYGSLKCIEERIPALVELAHWLSSVLKTSTTTASRLIAVLGDERDILNAVIPFLRFISNDMERSVDCYLQIFKNVINCITYQFVSAQSHRISSMFNSIAWANYVVLIKYSVDKDKVIFSLIFECIWILRIKLCRVQFLYDILGKPDETLLSGFQKLEEMKVIKLLDGHTLEVQLCYQYYPVLFKKCEESYASDLVCIEKLGFCIFGHFSEFDGNRLTWNYMKSKMWSLIQTLEKDIVAVSSAITCCYYCDCSIGEYIDKYCTIAGMLEIIFDDANFCRHLTNFASLETNFTLNSKITGNITNVNFLKYSNNSAFRILARAVSVNNAKFGELLSEHFDLENTENQSYTKNLKLLCNMKLMQPIGVGNAQKPLHRLLTPKMTAMAVFVACFLSSDLTLECSEFWKDLLNNAAAWYSYKLNNRKDELTSNSS